MSLLPPPSRILLPILAIFAALAAAPAQAQAPAEETAARTVERCRSSDLGKERTCYAAALDGRLAGGPAPALALLDALARLDPDVRRDGHMYAHRIGINALRSPAEVGRVFASCNPGWQSGCYHGVIQSYFLAAERAGGGVTAESVDALCGAYRGTRADLLFQCTHGLGHGLTMLHRHDLPKALTSCDLLGRESEREMCYAGAFMENIVNATHPHTGGPAPGQAAADPHAGHGGHSGHGGPVAAPPAWRALDPKDPHYPCSAFGEKYLIGCYTIQTSAMLHHSGYDVGKVAAECGRAPEKARVTCFVSLGRDVSTIAIGDNREGVRLCGLAEAAFRPACHRGVVESIVNMNADPAEGIPYCRAVAEETGKRVCYSSVGLQAMVLPDGEARRETACRAAEPGFELVCLNRLPPATAGASD